MMLRFHFKINIKFFTVLVPLGYGKLLWKCVIFYFSAHVFLLTTTLFLLLMFWVIKRVSICLFSIPASLAQGRVQICAFYNNALIFSNISIFCLILSLPYRSILLFQIINLIFNGKMFFLKKVEAVAQQ